MPNEHGPGAPPTMAEIMKEGFWNPQTHSATVDFRNPTDAEFDTLAAQLAAVIGEERAARPSMQRRMVIERSTGELLLTLDCPSQWFSAADPSWSAAPEPGPLLDTWLATEARAFRPEEAIALLCSRSGPEHEMERRRGIVTKRDDLRAQRQAEEDARAAKAREEADAAKKFRHREWSELPLARRMAYSLALALEKSQPEIAAQVWEVANAAEHLSAPQWQWWLPVGQRPAK
jgi:hypothetical protein